MKEMIGLFVFILTLTHGKCSCPSAKGPEEVGKVTDPAIIEASGLVASQTNPGVFWTFNDHNGPPCLYAVSLSGRLLHTLCLQNGTNTDWEAIQTAPCENGTMNMCLYIGDVGDNHEPRDFLTIYKVHEPEIKTDIEVPDKADTPDWQSLHFRYPNGQKFNCESMLIDSKTREFFLITKEKVPPISSVFIGDLDNFNSTENEVIEVQDTNIKQHIKLANDAAISGNRKVLIIRNYVGAYLWQNSADSIEETLKLQPCYLPIPKQRQGESVALNFDGSKYFLHAEDIGEIIWQYELS